MLVMQCTSNLELRGMASAGKDADAESFGDLVQDAHLFDDTDAIINFLAQRAEKNDLVLIMSNGGFDNIHQRLLESL